MKLSKAKQIEWDRVQKEERQYFELAAYIMALDIKNKEARLSDMINKFKGYPVLVIINKMLKKGIIYEPISKVYRWLD